MRIGLKFIIQNEIEELVMRYYLKKIPINPYKNKYSQLSPYFPISYILATCYFENINILVNIQ